MRKNSTKIVAATLALVLAMAMTACGGSDSSSSTPPAPSVTPSTPSTSTSSEPAPEASTPEELAKKYEDAIVAARDEEMNKYNPVTTNANKDDNKDTTIAGYIASAKEAGTEMTEAEAAERYTQDQQMLSIVTGIKFEDAEAYAISASMMNIKAYGIAIVKPVEGKGADMEKAMKDYVAAQQKAFESYLVDQREIADAAIVKTLEDGTVVMVMSENQDAIYDTIVAELAK